MDLHLKFWSSLDRHKSLSHQFIAVVYIESKMQTLDRFMNEVNIQYLILSLRVSQHNPHPDIRPSSLMEG